MPVLSSNLDYMIDDLRLHLGDTDSSSYRYTDDWLRTALVASVKSLAKWWNRKYLIDTNNDVMRNSDLEDDDYERDAPPIVLVEDERPIILMASIIIKKGSLEDNAWDYGSWRDDEIQYSNIEGSKAKQTSLESDIEELADHITPPTKKLAGTLKRDLIN